VQSNTHAFTDDTDNTDQDAILEDTQINSNDLSMLMNSDISSNSTNMSYTESTFSADDDYKPAKMRRNRYLGLAIQIRGNVSSSYPKIDMNSNEFFMSNFSFALLKPINDIFSYGIEVGSDKFTQEFKNTINGYDRTYQQNPPVLWVGLIMKSQMNERISFLGNAQPFAQVTLGGCEMGPVGKCSAGLQYNLDGLTLMLGLEGGLLAYQNQDDWYFSRKLGVTYGMILNF
jgi:hypothetical protein